MCSHNCGINHNIENIPENSLYYNINIDYSECFNESSLNPLKNCLKPYNKRHNDKYLESYDDKELLLKIIFNTTVDINGIRILSENNYCPNKLYFFKNISNLQFSNIEISNSIHDISPNNNIINDIIYPLPLYKFKNTDILYIYIDDNLGEETTRINYLDFNGKINKFSNKNKIVNCVYELKPKKKGFQFVNNCVVL